MKEQTSTDNTSNKLKKLLEKKRSCKTSNFKTNKNPNRIRRNTLTNIKKDLQNFNGYLKEINKRYQKIFKNVLKRKPKLERVLMILKFLDYLNKICLIYQENPQLI